VKRLKGNGYRELFQELAVACTYVPSARLENRAVGHRMEQWPEGAIAAAVVEIVELSLRDMNRYHLEETPHNTEVYISFQKRDISRKLLNGDKETM
jgi:hypothetical protein